MKLLADLSKQVNLLKNDYDSLATDLKLWAGRLATMETDLKSKVGEAGSRELEAAFCGDDSSDREQIGDLNYRLSVANERAFKAESHVASLRRQLDRSHGREDDLRKVADADAREKSDIRQQLDNYAGIVKAKEARICELQNEMAELRQQLDRAEGSVLEIKEDLERAQEEMDSKEDALNEAEDKCRNLEITLGNMRRAAQESQRTAGWHKAGEEKAVAELERLNEELKGLRDSAEAAAIDRCSLRDDAREATEAKVKLAKELESIREELHRASDAKIHLTRDLKLARRERDGALSEKDRLEKELNKTVDLNVIVTRERNAERKRSEELLLECRQLRSKIGKLRNERDKALDDKIDLKKQNENARIHMEKALAGKVKLKKELIECDQAKRRLVEDLDRKKRRAEAMEYKWTKLRAELEPLKPRIDEIESESNLKPDDENPSS